MSQTVFIVDDDPSVRDAISLWLECSGYDTLCFEGAMQFIQRVTHTLSGWAPLQTAGQDEFVLSFLLFN